MSTGEAATRGAHDGPPRRGGGDSRVCAPLAAIGAGIVGLSLGGLVGPDPLPPREALVYASVGLANVCYGLRGLRIQMGGAAQRIGSIAWARRVRASFGRLARSCWLDRPGAPQPAASASTATLTARVMSAP